MTINFLQVSREMVEREIPDIIFVSLPMVDPGAQNDPWLIPEWFIERWGWSPELKMTFG